MVKLLIQPSGRGRRFWRYIDYSDHLIFKLGFRLLWNGLRGSFRNVLNLLVWFFVPHASDWVKNTFRLTCDDGIWKAYDNFQLLDALQSGFRYDLWRWRHCPLRRRQRRFDRQNQYLFVDSLRPIEPTCFMEITFQKVRPFVQEEN